MSWDAIGAMAELLGAIGVIVSLVYLASQIRQNTNAMRGAAHESSVARLTSLSAAIGGNAQASEVVARGHRDYDALSHAERVQYVQLMTALMIGAEATYFQYERGNLEEAIWQRSLASIPVYVEFSGFRSFWEKSRGSYTKGFRDLVDDEVEQAKRAES